MLKMLASFFRKTKFGSDTLLPKNRLTSKSLEDFKININERINKALFIKYAINIIREEIKEIRHILISFKKEIEEVISSTSLSKFEAKEIVRDNMYNESKCMYFLYTFIGYNNIRKISGYYDRKCRAECLIKFIDIFKEVLTPLYSKDMSFFSYPFGIFSNGLNLDIHDIIEKHIRNIYNIPDHIILDKNKNVDSEEFDHYFPSLEEISVLADTVVEDFSEEDSSTIFCPSSPTIDSESPFCEDSKDLGSSSSNYYKISEKIEKLKEKIRKNSNEYSNFLYGVFSKEETIDEYRLKIIIKKNSKRNKLINKKIEKLILISKK